MGQRQKAEISNLKSAVSGRHQLERLGEISAKQNIAR
jgi:hypothetical protein